VSREYFGPEILIHAYKEGFFPMAESRYGEIYWHSPDPRAVIPIDTAEMSRSMKQFISKRNFEYRINYSFEEVIRACAERDETWINDEIIDSFCELNRLGLSHSVETWENGKLLGGLYGVCIGGAFFGESMFNYETNTSKAAFYELIRILRKNKFKLLDSQYINHHTYSLGAIEITRSDYMNRLKKALVADCKFLP
jgi:leucyl/phenylalanyl-tRNA--protein transferase